MQVKFGEFNAVQNEDIQQTHPDEIAGYLIKRSTINKGLFSVFAVDWLYEPLFCVESDLSLEEAQQKVDAVNKEYFPVVPTETELVEIQLAEEKRIFKVAK